MILKEHCAQLNDVEAIPDNMTGGSGKAENEHRSAGGRVELGFKYG